MEKILGVILIFGGAGIAYMMDWSLIGDIIMIAAIFGGGSLLASD